MEIISYSIRSEGAAVRAKNREFTLGEVQEPPSVGLRTAPCIALTPYGITTTEEAGAIPTLGRTGLTTYRVVSFCGSGLTGKSA